MISEKSIQHLREIFGRKLQENVLLANYTTMQVGGPTEALLIANSAGELVEIISKLWELELPVKVLGSGSNLLVSDKGIRAVTVINHAHNIKINTRSKPFTVWAESGALLVNVGKKLALWGLKGMEWAATIPGTVGGAVYGNAGAFGGETCGNLIAADILQRDEGRSEWPCEKLDFTYRASNIKRDMVDAVILAAKFEVSEGNREEIQENIEKFRKRRRHNQPPGASVGSIFRNPEDEKAGRLIEAVGLKGKRIGGAVISEQHANFIINEGGATAKDILTLLEMAHNKVMRKFNIALIPEIEVIGDWDDLPDFLQNNYAAKAVK